jgi:hypothetical protein
MPTVEAAPRRSRPPIRVRPAPRLDPPFDDELEGSPWADFDGWPGAQQLAFQFPPAPIPGTGRPDPVPTRAEPPEGTASPPGPSGDAKLAVRRFVRMCVEVLNGYRPAAHLRCLALPRDAAAVVAQAVAGTSRVADIRQSQSGRGAARVGRRAAGAQAGRNAAGGPTGRNAAGRAESQIVGNRPIMRRDRRPGPVGVIRLRTCEPRPGAVEAAVLLVTGDRTWAMALRMELHEQTWSATTLRLI